MKWQAAAAAVLAASVIGPASAQVNGTRRFTQEDPGDTNRSNREIYYPVVRKVSGTHPGDVPYLLSSAAWFEQAPGSAGRKPDLVRDKGEYLLERFEPIKGDTHGQMQVVISRTPAPPEGTAPPQLRLIEAESGIEVRGTPTVERTADGLRYSFTVTPARTGIVSAGNTSRYQLDFLPARNVPLPSSLATAPTFGGGDYWDRMASGPPHLPYRERVAGKRIEFRSASSGGQVVDTRVAGSRQEFRKDGR